MAFKKCLGPSGDSFSGGEDDEFGLFENSAWQEAGHDPTAPNPFDPFQGEKPWLESAKDESDDACVNVPRTLFAVLELFHERYGDLFLPEQVELMVRDVESNIQHELIQLDEDAYEARLADSLAAMLLSWSRQELLKYLHSIEVNGVGNA